MLIGTSTTRSPEQYAAIYIPILTITGSYDGDQPGALMHYREHLKACGSAARARHYLVIGPWDHAGTRVPKQEFCGIKVGPAEPCRSARGCIDEWYAWTMQGRPNQGSCRKTSPTTSWAQKDGAMQTLWTHNSAFRPALLDSTGNPTDASARDRWSPRQHGATSRIGIATIHMTSQWPNSRARWILTTGRMTAWSMLRSGKHLVYHGAPFTEDTEISGFFKLIVWLSIDRPDTDFRAGVYEVALGGGSILLDIRFDANCAIARVCGRANLSGPKSRCATNSSDSPSSHDKSARVIGSVW